MKPLNSQKVIEDQNVKPTDSILEEELYLKHLDKQRFKSKRLKYGFGIVSAVNLGVAFINEFVLEEPVVDYRLSIGGAILSASIAVSEHREVNRLTEQINSLQPNVQTTVI